MDPDTYENVHEHHGWDSKYKGGRMKEENILLSGEAKFTDEEFTIIKMLLEDYLVKVQIALRKINHLQREEKE